MILKVNAVRLYTRLGKVVAKKKILHIYDRILICSPSHSPYRDSVIFDIIINVDKKNRVVFYGLLTRYADKTHCFQVLAFAPATFVITIAQDITCVWKILYGIHVE